MLLGDQTVFFSSKSSIVTLDHNGLTHVNMFSNETAKGLLVWWLFPRFSCQSFTSYTDGHLQ